MEDAQDQAMDTVQIIDDNSNDSIADAKIVDVKIVDEAPSLANDAFALYNALQDYIISNSSPEALIKRFRDAIESIEDKANFRDSLSDAVNQCDVESSLMDKECRDRLINITKQMIMTNIIPHNLALERFELDTNAQLGVVHDKRQFSIIYTRLKTKIYFKQKKYNLLREQNEGSAKILTELSSLNRSKFNEVQDTLLTLIGAYHVDPNRVVDLVLSVFENNSEFTDGQVYIDFIKSFYHDIGRILNLIILRLTMYTNSKGSPSTVPQTFYRMLAILIHNQVIDLDDIYPYLLPDDTKALKYHQKLVEEGKEISRQYAMAVLGGPSGEEKARPKTVRETLEEENPIDYHYLERDNHKLNLFAHLVAIGDWDQASYLADKLPEYFCFSYRPAAEQICKYIEYIIDPIYRECGLPRPLNLRIKPLISKYFKPDEQITTISQLTRKLFPILLKVGPFLTTQTVTKTIRVLTYALLAKENDTSDQTTLSSENELYYQILDVIAYSVLPATSLKKSNCCLARELWSLVKHFKYQIRYKLYNEWKDDANNPILLKNKGHLLLAAKRHMKRLSKDSLRSCGRHIGKLSYQHPVIILNYVISQIISYDNLIILVVEALKFLPSIALDSLIYCIIEYLSDSHRNKKSSDGMALAPWLTNISTFSSSILTRYKVDFISFLEYIANQLKIGNSLDLVLLTDLIIKMSGIETIQQITDERIEALLGGDVLRTEGAYYNQVKNTRKPSARLRDALVESKLAMPLCILIAQLRDRLFFAQQDPLKLVGKLYDQCQETFAQYGVFLSMNLSIEDYIKFLPPLDKLMTEHRLDPDTAFSLARPMIFHRIRSTFNELKEISAKELPVEEGEAPELNPQTLGIKFVEAARSVIDPIAETIQPILAQKYTSCNLNSKLFVIFWTLSMSDIEVPESCYEREILRLTQIMTNSPDNESKARKEKDRCKSLVTKLNAEKAELLEHVRYIKMYLESERNNLFCENSTYDNVYLESRQFVQHCPFARCILTACDAIYSARFMLFLHELKVENYPTIICLDRLLCDLTYMMGACTENEASHYGRFLCNILRTTAHWHSKAEIYAAQCEHYPGSIINIDNNEELSYEVYRDICYKWHYRLTRSFSIALESNNYIQIRNALIVMISIIDHYPAIKHFGKGIGIKIEEVRANEKDSRQDLYALATAYAGKLDERKPNLIPESNFHTVDAKTSQKDRHSSSSSGSRKKARHT